MPKTLMTCPECKKRGITLRLRPNGEDHYGCRYCDWATFVYGNDEWDVVGRGQLRRANPGHPDRPPPEPSPW